MKKVLILNYHNISNDISRDSLYSISPELFTEHMRIIQRLRIPVQSLKNVLNDSVTEDYSIVISFDDGYKSDLEVALPLLMEHRFPAIFFPIIGRIGTSGRLTWEELKIISGNGYEIGSHGMTHKNLKCLPAAEIEMELKKSKSLIEEQIKSEVEHFSLPYGSYNSRILKSAQTLGYKSVLTTGLKINLIHNNNFLFFRWNITSKTTIEQLTQVLLCNGRLPIRLRTTFLIKQMAKRILGSVMSEKLKRGYSNE